MHFDDTIAAVSTPAGRGGISIVRVSGNAAVEIADKVFKNEYGKKLADAKTHTITHGFATRLDGTVIDEVLCSVMLAPSTYTRENVVEISCHGSDISTKEILSALLFSGARLAEPGEFTKRAFLNGRMDLCSAESVIDIINAETDASHRVSVNQLKGSLSQKINEIRERLLTLISHLQVLIDFADEDLEPLSDDEYLNGLKGCLSNVKKLIDDANDGMIIKKGISCAIAGKPNVGKSSLLNLLCGDDRAIVTDIEGTTRDTIEASVTLGGVRLNLMDTAGIRETTDKIEEIGVKKAMDAISDADLVLFVTDAKREPDKSDFDIVKSLEGQTKIALINKAEDGVCFDDSYLRDCFDVVIEFSVKTGLGLDVLESKIKQMFLSGDISTSDRAIITNVRHVDALRKAASSLESAIEEIERGIELNMTFIDIENAISALGEITGQTVAEEIVDRIFHSFCVGK